MPTSSRWTGEIGHHKINDKMKNGKQIQFVINARINKFYEIAQGDGRRYSSRLTSTRFGSRIVQYAPAWIL